MLARLMSACALLVCLMVPSSSQMMMGLDKSVTTTKAFQGAGDVVSGAVAWWGLRAYTAAYAAGLNKLAIICKASDSVCDDVKSDANGNFNIAASLVSACNNTTTICTVKQLYDQSGNTSCNGNACNMANATEANRPILIVAGAANGCSSTSLPCMSFNGTTQQLATGNVISNFNQANTISVVYNINNSDSTAHAFYGDAGNGTIPGRSGATNNSAGLYCGVSTSAVTATDSVWHAGQFIANNASSIIRIDSTSTTGLTCGTGVQSSTIFIGNDGFGDIYKGLISEVGYWNTGFTDPTQTSNMSSNQHSYWGF